ncbi:acetyl-CoA sensor PanZ family protein [Halomonas sp. Bachu 37]|uniref:acetyl-CoA sensor PanZ family protein n=1 Tax=Halomonas kashgarensis TaxID=3084920 RepID=UPI0032167794
MPVTLQYVDQSVWEADAQKRLDLERIYQDAPQERIANSATRFIEQHLAAGHCFACALFNERLLGAVVVEVVPDAWWLSQLCVRKTTRRRGVGTRLMALMADRAAEERRVLRIATRSLPFADRVLLSKLGYRPVATSSPAAATSEAMNSVDESDYVELVPQGKE